MTDSILLVDRNTTYIKEVNMAYKIGTKQERVYTKRDYLNRNIIRTIKSEAAATAVVDHIFFKYHKVATVKDINDERELLKSKNKLTRSEVEFMAVIGLGLTYIKDISLTVFLELWRTERNMEVTH